MRDTRDRIWVPDAPQRATRGGAGHVTLKTCLIINPAAGKKAGVTTNEFGIDDARALLARHGIEATVFCTERAEHGFELGKQAVAEGFERVIAAGGDGTVAEVAEGLVGSDVILGVLPLGSVMNVARMLGIPRDLEGAARIITDGPVTRIDAGRAHGTARARFFLEAAGVGIDAGLFAYANEVDRGNWRSIGPFLTFLRRYRPRRLEVRLDGKISRFRAMMVTVANGPFLGAAMTLAPDAQLDDGLFDVRIFTHFSKAELIRHFISIFGGRRAYNPKVLARRAKTVEVFASRPLMAHADSHPLGSTPARFELLPGAIRIAVGGSTALDPTLSVPPQAISAGVGSVPEGSAPEAVKRPPLATPTY
jgi:diacylglycerol kinase (ATP)